MRLSYDDFKIINPSVVVSDSTGIMHLSYTERRRRRGQITREKILEIIASGKGNTARYFADTLMISIKTIYYILEKMTEDNKIYISGKAPGDGRNMRSTYAIKKV